jgi:hypothetical protein
MEASGSHKSPKRKHMHSKEGQAHTLFLASNDGKLLAEQCKFCFITLSTFPGSQVALEGTGKGKGTEEDLTPF